MKKEDVAQGRVGRPVWLVMGFWGCVVIALAVVVRRLLTLAQPSESGPPPMVAMDRAFATHAGLTVGHIVPAAVFVVLAAVVLVWRVRRGWVEWGFFLFGAVTGLTAYAMSAFAVGGWVERSAVMVFDTWFLVSLGQAWWSRLRGDMALQREWMVRAVGILLGIATTRPVMGVFFATSAKTGLRPDQFFGIAFWIGFSVNMLVVEWWLRSRRRMAAAEISGEVV